MAVESMPSTEATTCPNCEQKEGDHPLFCTGCGHLFPEDEGANHFALFGLTPSFDIDEGELELKLIDISRRFHPDFLPPAMPSSRSSASSIPHRSTPPIKYSETRTSALNTWYSSSEANRAAKTKVFRRDFCRKRCFCA